MKKLLFIVVCIAVVLCVNVLTAGAQNNNANTVVTNINADVNNGVEAGILPDSPFYFLKSLWEKVRETFTLRSEAKLQYMEKLGEKRAVEAEKMIEKGNPEKAQKVMDKYNQRLEKMKNFIDKKGEKLDKKLESAEQRIKNRFEHRNQILQKVMDKAPDKAKAGLQRALDNSKNQLQKLELKIKEKIQKRDQLNDKLRNRLENVNITPQPQCGTCPEYAPPAPGWCSECIIVPGEKDKCGCQQPPKCICGD